MSVGKHVFSQPTVQGIRSLMLKLKDLEFTTILHPYRTAKAVPKDTRTLNAWYSSLEVIVLCRPATPQMADGSADLCNWWKLVLLSPLVAFGPEKLGGPAPGGSLIWSRLANFLGSAEDLLARLLELQASGHGLPAFKPSPESAERVDSEDSVDPSAEDPASQMLSPPTQGKLNTLVAAGELSKAFRLLIQSTSVSARVLVNESNIHKLLALFPQQEATPTDSEVAKRFSSIPSPPSAVPPAEVSSGPEGPPQRGKRVHNDARSVIQSAAKCSAPGLTPWRAEYINSPRFNQNLLGGLQLALTDLADGLVPPELQPYLYGGRLICISKPDGGLRPIVIRDFFDKSGARMLSTVIADEAKSFFLARYQYGVGASAGSETVVNAVRAMLQDALPDSLPGGYLPPRRVLVKLDCSNAFNSVSRRLVLSQVKKYFPSLEKYVASHYPINFPSPTLVGVQLESGEIRWIPTKTGVHQGDPLGPALFALALNAVLERTVELCGGPATFENAYIGAVLDDVCIVAPPTLARTFCDAFVQANSELGSGLRINASKIQIFPSTSAALDVFTDGEDSPWASAKFVPDHCGVRLMGSPVGSAEFCSKFWLDEVNSTNVPVMDLLAKVEHLQTRILLARYCGASRAAFMMRSSHPTYTKKAAAVHDAAVAKFAATMLHESSKGVLSASMLAQARLPLRLGGVGLTAASGSGSYAYFAAFSDALRTLLSIDPPASISPSESDRGNRSPLVAGDAPVVNPTQSESAMSLALRHLFTSPPSISETGVLTPPPEPPDRGKSPALPSQDLLDTQSASLADEASSSDTAGLMDVLADPPSRTYPPSLLVLLNDFHREIASDLQALANLPSGAVLSSSDLDGLPSSFEGLCSTKPKLQKRASNVRHKLNAALLRLDAPALTSARLIAVAQEGATDFLRAIPSDPRLTLRNDELSYAISRLLGSAETLEHYAALALSCPTCKSHSNIASAKYTHVDNCKVGGNHIYRHDELVRNWAKMLRRAGHSFRIEPRGQFSESQGGPDGVGSVNGKRFLMELSLVNPLIQPVAASKTPLQAAQEREKLKELKFKSTASLNRMDLEIVVFETTGGQGKKSKTFLHSISKKWHVDNPDTPVPTFLDDQSATWAARTLASYWKQIFSVCIVKSSFAAACTVQMNASMIIGRRASHHLLLPSPCRTPLALSMMMTRWIMSSLWSPLLPHRLHPL